MKGASRALGWLAALIGVLAAGGTSVAMQDTTSDDHASHHPAREEAPSSATGSPMTEPDPPRAGTPQSGMGGMEKMMQVTEPELEPLYPFLMRFPDLTAEARLAVTQRAEREARESLLALDTALQVAREASQADDVATAARATQEVSEALARVEGARLARRLLREDQPPREAALAWFRGEMSLAATGASAEAQGARAAPWRHNVGVGALAALAVALLISFGLRVRRTSKLLASLGEEEHGDA